MILAGDIGGTKTRLVIYELCNNSLELKGIERFDSAKYASLEEIVSIFLNKHSVSPKAACFGIPGPVVDGKVKLTNLPWSLDEVTISKSLNIPKIKLVNDLVATAAAIPFFKEKDLITLNSGTPQHGDGVSVVIAPGTGLGQSILVTENGNHSVLASEGGHSNFAPINDMEFELSRYLSKKFDQVSVERVLCGPGLVNIYEFLRDTSYAKESPEVIQSMRTEPAAAVIAEYAQEKGDILCSKALDMFTVMLGAHASNIMITVLGTKGVYLGGGVPPKILKKLSDGSILKGFLKKGKMKDLFARTPLYVIKDDHAAVNGAAQIAVRLL